MRWLALMVAALAAGCASGICDTCPTVAFTANGETDLVVDVGTEVTYAWSSTGADVVSSTATIDPSPDGCGNVTGPWVIDTAEGARDPEPILPCQTGVTYTLSVEVGQTDSDDRATADVTISVR